MSDLDKLHDGTLEAAVAFYLHRVESGGRADIDEITGSLEAADRDAFRELVGAIGWAREQFPSPLSPTRLVADRYELRNELGAGGFGKVWRAWDRRVEKHVAIKFCDLMTKDALDVQQLFAAERKALARIDRPGIARILDHGQDDDRLFLVMDLIEGRPLSQVLEELERRVPPDELPKLEDLRAAIGMPCSSSDEDLTDGRSYLAAVVRIVVSMLRSLEAVHAADVLHRDLKPSNVILKAGGHPVLLDFGMASLQEDRRGKVTEGLVGTLPYLAPEQLQRRRIGADRRTDVYQVGLVLYELLTLKPAFDPREAAGLFELVRNGSIARPRSRVGRIPHELEDVCLMALETNPERRYPTATAFREDLERWSSGTSAPRASRGGALAGQVRNFRYFARRHRAATIAAAGIAAGALLAAVWIGGAPSVTLVSCSMPAPDQIEAEVVLDAEQVVFVMAIATNTESGASTYLPLRPAGDPDQTTPMSTRVASGATRLRLKTPDGRTLSSEPYDERRIQVYAATDEVGVAALSAAFDQLAQSAQHDYAGLPGVPRDVALRLLNAMDLPGSRSGGGPGSPLGAARLLDGGSWDEDGLAATTMVLPNIPVR